LKTSPHNQPCSNASLGWRAALGVLLLAVLACNSPASPLEWLTPTPIPPTATPVPPTATVTPTLAPPTATVTSIPLARTPNAKATPLTAGMVMREVTYCTMEGIPLKMDIRYPQTGNGPWPVVIYVHSGAWMGGSKLDPFGDVDAPALTAAGYMAVSVMYRLAPEHPFPAQIEDVKCAVRYLRAHAADYNLDPQRIGARGASAGGHLVSLLGLADESAGWDVGEYLDQSSRVQAVVNMFGPADLADDTFIVDLNKEANILFGFQKPTTEMLRSASPITYIRADAPPFLLIHGDQDSTVKLKQSEIFYAALAAAGVPTELVVVENAEHGFIPVGAEPMTPTREQITQIMIEFFDKYLKP